MRKTTFLIPVLFLLIFISLQNVFAQIPTSVTLGTNLRNNIITLGQPFTMTISATGVSTLEGMPYEARWCKVERDTCAPTNIGTLPGETLSTERGWTFSGASANKTITVTGVTPGFYTLRVFLNGIPSNWETFEIVQPYTSRLVEQVASGNRYVFVCLNSPAELTIPSPNVQTLRDECGLRAQEVITPSQDVVSLSYNVAQADDAFYIYICNADVIDPEVFSSTSAPNTGLACTVHSNGTFQVFSIIPPEVAPTAPEVPVVTFIDPTPANGATSETGLFNIRVNVQSRDPIDQVWLTFSGAGFSMGQLRGNLQREDPTNNIFSVQIRYPPAATYVYRVYANTTNGIEGVSEDRTITVTRSLDRIEISPSPAIVNVGASLQFRVEAIFSDGTREDRTNEATCTSSNTNIATVNNCAVTGVNTGTTEITATLGGRQATSTLQVTRRDERRLSYITISPENPRINIDRNVEFFVHAYYSDNPSQGILVSANCRSSNTSIATMNNCIAIPQGIGTAVITAEFQEREDSASLIVEPTGTRLLSNLDIEPDNLVINVGTSRNFNVFAIFSDGTREDRTNEATCTSSNTNIATVNNCAVTGQNVGLTNIVANFGGLSISTNLEVVASGSRILSELRIEPRNATVEIDQTRAYRLTARFSDNSEQDVTGDRCTSRNTNIATVTNCVARGITAGLTTIVAEYSAGGRTVNDEATLTIVEAGALPPRECTPGETRVCFPIEFTIGTGAGTEDFFNTWHQTCNGDGFFGACTRDTLIANRNLRELTCIDGQNWTCPRQFGVCQGSVQTCTSNQFPGCEQVYNNIPSYEAVETTLNDGLDNDCDGSIDEGGFCNTISQQCSSLVGECTAGIQECRSNVWQSCNFTNANLPEPEILDNRDNDCDGSIDEGFSDPIIGRPIGSTRSCGSDIGECNAGQQVYTNETFIGFSVWSICNNVVLPRFEPSRLACGNGLDDDCDISIDEDCFCDPAETPTRSCGTSVGVCSAGTQTCTNNQWSACSTITTSPSFEQVETRCDDLDNDCDGTVDEGCACILSSNVTATTRPCELQSGVCQGFNQTCLNGDWQACDFSSIEEFEEREQSCSDSLDNDCDGQVDRNDSDCEARGLRCSDGTLDRQCSSDQPKFCDAGALQYNCNECGCGFGEECSSNGQCVSRTPTTVRVPREERVPTEPELPGEEIPTEEPRFSKLMLILLIILVLMLVALVLFLYYSKRKKKSKPDLTFKPIITTNLKQVSKPFEEVSKTLQEHSNIEQLYGYVRISLERGKDLEEIKNASLDAGWTSKEVDDAIKRAKARLERKKALQNLFEYVKFSLSKGKNIYDIKDILIKAGWNSEDITNAIDKAKIAIGKEREQIKFRKELEEAKKAREKELELLKAEIKPKKVAKKKTRVKTKK